MTGLQISDLTKTFGGIIALDDVSFEVESGEIMGLIGPNGAGKTTVFNCISRLYDPDRGSINFEGHELVRMGAPEVVHVGIARTFQNVELFRTMSVVDNLLVGQHHRLGPTWARQPVDELKHTAGDLMRAGVDAMETGRFFARDGAASGAERRADGAVCGRSAGLCRPPAVDRQRRPYGPRQGAGDPGLPGPGPVCSVARRRPLLRHPEARGAGAGPGGQPAAHPPGRAGRGPQPHGAGATGHRHTPHPRRAPHDRAGGGAPHGAHHVDIRPRMRPQLRPQDRRGNAGRGSEGPAASSRPTWESNSDATGHRHPRRLRPHPGPARRQPGSARWGAS